MIASTPTTAPPRTASSARRARCWGEPRSTAFQPDVASIVPRREISIAIVGTADVDRPSTRRLPRPETVPSDSQRKEPPMSRFLVVAAVAILALAGAATAAADEPNTQMYTPHPNLVGN